MRLCVINCIFLACAATVFAEDTEDVRPKRHLHQIKEMIVNKLFSASEPNCTQSAPPPPLETKFFKIPGFNNVVIKAVPKSSQPAPIPEKLPPNSHIGIVGSYLGTSTLNETYNALLGVKNLLTSGILSAKRDALNELSLEPQKVRIIAKPLIKPCKARLSMEPVKVLVNPPIVPIAPTQYSYKQVNQDGSVTTHSSSLDLNNGVRVTEDGKTLPFLINRVRKIPVRLPVPVLPEISRIIVSKVTQPTSTYVYQQTHQDGRMTSYLGLPPLISRPGPVVVTETRQRVPPPPAYLVNRIEKVAAIATVPRKPFIDVVPEPVVVHTPVDHVISAPLPKPPPAQGSSGYSYSQMNMNGGMTTHSASGVNGAVLVTENGSSAPLSSPTIPENPFRQPPGFGAYSYSQIHAGGQMSNYNGAQAGPVNVLEHRPLPVLPISPVLPVVSLPPSSFSYKQIGDGRMTTYTGAGIYEESSNSVVVHGGRHPVPPSHITDRIEKVAAGAKFNRVPYSSVLFAKPIALPVPDPAKYVLIPPVHTSMPQRPVKMPTTSNMSPFLYKQTHRDGSMVSYGAGGQYVEEGKKEVPPPANMAKPFPQGKVRVIDSSIYEGPVPMDTINLNAIKPSTPVSGSYSYKMVNNNMGSSLAGPTVDTFAAPPPFPNVPVPTQACFAPDIKISGAEEIGNPFLRQPPNLMEYPVPITYSYKQMSHGNTNPVVVVNIEDPAKDVKKVNMDLNHSTQVYQPLVPSSLPANLPSAVHVVEHKPTLVQPLPFIPVPQVLESQPSFSYKQIQSQAYPPARPTFQSDVTVTEHRPNTFVQPPVPVETAPPSLFSYKQVQSQSYPPTQLMFQPAVTVTEHRPNAFIKPPLTTSAPVESAPPSSFSYKQVTNQAPQIPAAGDVIEHRPSSPAPSPMINTRLPQTENDSPSSFSYKQVTSQGVYEYSDEFPTGVKTNRMPPRDDGNPSGDVYEEQKPLLSSPVTMPDPIQPMPLPAAPTPIPDLSTPISTSPVPIQPMPVEPSAVPIHPSPTFNRQDSLVNNPIVVPEQSSFSFKSSNPDGSTITVKDDGHNSIAVELEDAHKAEESQNAPVSIIPNMEPVKDNTMNAGTERTPAPISGHAKPTHRRVLKRVRPVKHRGDIPEASE